MLRLEHPFIFAETLKLVLDSSLELLPNKDFAYDARTSTVRLTPSFRALIFAAGDTRTHHLSLAYSALPLQLKKAYSRFEVRSSADDTSRVVVATTPEKSPSKDLFANFQRSGAITRGFQLGSSRDLSLTSGFNLQFSGDIADQVTVTGALTEESIPIQPEGNTQTLRELDRIYINVRGGKYVEATFGDFILDMNAGRSIARVFEHQDPLTADLERQRRFSELAQTSFTALSRKVLGVEARGTTSWGGIAVGAASNKGVFMSNEMQGQELYQGPYRLNGKNGSRAAPVLAGTERVYIDGVLQTRGERNDYVIDYSLGEITFQARRLITASSRITVDFEYAEQNYSRTLLAAQAQALGLGGNAFIGVTALQEGDNPDATLTLSLSEADKAILIAAGADPSRARRSGVSFAGRDSTGRAKGTYVRRDSLVGSTPVTYYVFAPHDSINALFDVSFGIQTQGRGAYRRVALSQFEFVGVGLGEYDTLIPLPLPTRTEVIDIKSILSPFEGFTIDGDLALSRFSPNRFTPISEVGNAYRIQGKYQDSLSVGGSRIGDISLGARSERVGNAFRTLDRLNAVEFNRTYGLDALLAQPTNNAYTLHEGSLSYSPIAPIRVGSTYSKFLLDSLGLSSERLMASLEVREDSTLPFVQARYENIPVHLSGERMWTWQKQHAAISKSVPLSSLTVRPSLSYGRESKELDATAEGLLASLGSRGYAFHEVLAALGVDATSGFSSILSYSRRAEDSSIVTGTPSVPVSTANTYRLTASLQRPIGLAGSVTLSYRDKRFVDSISRTRNGGDQQGLALRLEPRYSDAARGIAIDGLYDVSNQRTSRIERLFLPVQPGFGSYRYLGDLNNNRQPDPEEFSLARYADEGAYILLTVPSEQLFPTTDLKSSVRIRINPAAYAPKPEAWWEHVLSALSTETVLRLEEVSTHRNEADIYLLKLSAFQKDSTTLRGLQEIDQALYLLSNNPAHNYILRFIERIAADQFTTGLERTYRAERSIRGRFRPSLEWTNETSVRSVTDLALTRSQYLGRPHNVGSYHAETDWGFHPMSSKLDYGLRLEGFRGQDRYPTNPITVRGLSASSRVGYAVETRTRLRLELQREELTIDESETSTLPYVLTGGRSPGISWLWRAAVDYNMGSGVVVTTSYDGRNIRLSQQSSERETVHNARAEIRAAF